MSKFLKRIGTISSRYIVEIHLTRVELSLVQQCRIALTLKRGKFGLYCQLNYFFSGDHTAETKNAIALEKGVAKFDETLTIPATLYQEKKKGNYMKKEVSFLITHSNLLGNNFHKCSHSQRK